MATAGFIAIFVVIGAGVAFVAFSGGPGAAREAYLTGGRRGFKVAIPLIYVGLGVAVPAIVLASRGGETKGATEELAAQEVTGEEKQGKDLFRRNCASCHTLDAVGARGVTGPDLDNVGRMTEDRVVNAIRLGGTGQGRMPANIIQGEDARAVAKYLAGAAGE